MCEYGTPSKQVFIKGKRQNLMKYIDPCISDLIKELNEHGIRTVYASCCGHNKTDGYILIDASCVGYETFDDGTWAFKLIIPKMEMK